MTKRVRASMSLLDRSPFVSTNLMHLDLYSTISLDQYRSKSEIGVEYISVCVTFPKDFFPPTHTNIHWLKLTLAPLDTITWEAIIICGYDFYVMMNVLNFIDQIPEVISIYGLKYRENHTPIIDSISAYGSLTNFSDGVIAHIEEIPQTGVGYSKKREKPSYTPKAPKPRGPPKGDNTRSNICRLLGFRVLFSLTPSEDIQAVFPRKEWDNALAFVARNKGNTIKVFIFKFTEVSVTIPFIFDRVVHSYVVYGPNNFHEKEHKTIFRWWSTTSIKGVSPVTNYYHPTDNLTMIERRFYIPEKLATHPSFIAHTQSAVSSGDSTNLIHILRYFFSLFLDFYATHENINDVIGMGVTRIKVRELRPIEEAQELAVTKTIDFLENYVYDRELQQ